MSVVGRYCFRCSCPIVASGVAVEIVQNPARPREKGSINRYTICQAAAADLREFVRRWPGAPPSTS